ncbi:ABC transporter ATP-binding protein [Brevibacterium ammoniilyticum]|uniref:ABC transporter ATP-binding protein n=1 Tax=Brevibacterium ammoniilyticum TaxID=1046555 RepID=A0ABP9TYR6_9MICO
MTNPAFELHHVGVRLGGRDILHDLSLTIPADRTTAIIGANGSGKSTLLRTLARLQERTGSVLRHGAEISGIRPRAFAQDVALLPQAPEAPANLTVTDLVSRGRDPHRRWYDQWSAADERIVNEALAATGLADMGQRGLGTLSGGQRQRAWIALTLTQSPSLLLLDEPTTYLDVAHQIDVLETVTALQRSRGMTVILVLHDLGMAVRYADHIIAVQDGRIAAEGPAESTLTPSVIRDVFGIDSAILTDPVTGRPVIVPHRALETTEAP